ncbi:glycoside hydrolase [Aspergillus pseudoustus]|uniref:Glycoside hydrolase n=1 Tax=Aspergillus pseudoustus TaxID=1810923 RepID=A0ABR4JLV7_9EURO
MPVATDLPWWKEACIYQIYPASFKDSNGDGIGDIPGIISKLDHIKSLGVDAIWICPMFASPQCDMGYDISDYEAVYPPYGTVDDMERLITECHARSLRVLLDLVINHTSHLHAWFQESRSSKNNPKRDWYIWRPPTYATDGQRRPPNNWRAAFEGSVWEWDEHTQEYYLHYFAPEQPDLNWDNPATRAAIYESAMRFWLRKGIDGFRVDTANLYSKNTQFPNAAVTDLLSPWQPAFELFCNGPRIHEYIRELNQVLGEFGAMTVGELPCTPDVAKVLKYVSEKERQLNMVFQFEIVELGSGIIDRYNTVPRNWELTHLKAAVQQVQCFLAGTDGWTATFLENHDQARSVSRFGCDETPGLRASSAKMLAIFLAGLSGTLFLHQGQEIGMVNAPITWPISEYKDIASINYYNAVKNQTNGDAAALQRAKVGLQHIARDHGRLPMQWDSTFNAGFTEAVQSWMRVHDNYADINVERQNPDAGSVLSFWKSMLRLRKEQADVLVYGDFRIIDESNENIFIYEKKAGDKCAYVVLNFTREVRHIDLHSIFDIGQFKLIAQSSDHVSLNRLDPFEGRLYVKEDNNEAYVPNGI